MYGAQAGALVYHGMRLDKGTGVQRQRMRRLPFTWTSFGPTQRPSSDPPSSQLRYEALIRRCTTQTGVVQRGYVLAVPVPWAWITQGIGHALRHDP
jgi:hypothetical protein